MAQRPGGHARSRLAFAGYLTIGLSLPLAATPLPPTLAVDKTITKIGGWSIGSSSSLGGCVAAATFGDQTTVWFGYNGARKSAYLAFTNPRWNSIEPGQDYTLAMRARGHGNWKGSFIGIDRDGDRGLFSSGLKDKFLSDFATTGSLSVSVGPRHITTLSLVGSMEALEAVLECQKDYTTVRARADVRPNDERNESRRKGGSQGTGFFVSRDGHLVTNNHVVDECSAVTVTQPGSPPIRAQVVARDGTNDLAVLKVASKPDAVPALATRARVGENVYAYGFPLSGLLATTGNFTAGSITATAGMGDDTRMVQISAPVQPGNSGGPLLDQSGNVVGVIVSKLNVMSVARITDDLAQNVNFAIKTTILLNFLDANGVDAVTDARRDRVFDGASLAELAKSFVVRVNCS